MAKQDKVYQITVEGKMKLEEELDYISGEKRQEIIQALQEARSQGDLSENADYDAARDAQAQNEARIAEIEYILKNHSIILESADKNTVSVGRKVIFAFLNSKGKAKQNETFTIVGSVEANPFENKISNEAPLAMALLGHKAGDKVVFDSPNGEVTIKIIDIK